MPNFIAILFFCLNKNIIMREGEENEKEKMITIFLSFGFCFTCNVLKTWVNDNYAFQINICTWVNDSWYPSWKTKGTHHIITLPLNDIHKDDTHSNILNWTIFRVFLDLPIGSFLLLLKKINCKSWSESGSGYTIFSTQTCGLVLVWKAGYISGYMN
jgi:hypothetical protein